MVICDALHVGRIPDRLEERVGEAEIEQVLHRLLPEEVIDAIDRLLGKRLVQRGVERARRRQVAAERLLHDQSGVRGHPRPRQARRHDAEQARRNGQVEGRAHGATERLAQAVEGGRVLIVAGHVRQARDEPFVGGRVDAPVSREALADARAHLVEAPRLTRDRDDRHAQLIVPGHRLQRGKDLLIGQIAGGAEQDERVGSRVGHDQPPAGRSTWPPN